MPRPTNVVVEMNETVRSFEQMLRKFLRICKDEGIIKEHLEQFQHETKGQKTRRQKREGRRRHQKKSNEK